MNTTPDSTAATWRDLADELTPEQVGQLRDLEAHLGGGGRAAFLLAAAREFLTDRQVADRLADVPLPAGARTDTENWTKNLRRDGYSRSLVWRTWRGGMADLRLAGSVIAVDIDGRQQSDGSFTRGISLWGVDEGAGLTADQARAVAALLVGAADELDRLS